MKLLGQLSSWSCLASSCFRLSEKKETVEMGDKSSHFHCLLFVNTLKLMTLLVYWTPLEFYTGQDGFMQLLTLISDGGFESNDEILEVIKRIFVKDYEKARFHFKAAISERYFEPNTKAGFHTESDIQSTLDYINKEARY